MFEDSIYNLLINSEIVDYVSKYNNVPAIFCDFAPEDAEFPYLTFKININSTENILVNEFNLYIDYFVYNNYQQARYVISKLEIMFDRYFIPESDKVSAIRLFFFSSGNIPEEDPKVCHYNILFTGKMSRKNYSLTT